jgi:hypothetical protein
MTCRKTTGWNGLTLTFVVLRTHCIISWADESKTYFPYSIYGKEVLTFQLVRFHEEHIVCCCKAESNSLPDTLQKVDIGIISTAECSQRLSSINGATPTNNMVCLYDTSAGIGSCNVSFALLLLNIIKLSTTPDSHVEYSCFKLIASRHIWKLKWTRRFQTCWQKAGEFEG